MKTQRDIGKQRVLCFRGFSNNRYEASRALSNDQSIIAKSSRVFDKSSRTYSMFSILCFPLEYHTILCVTFLSSWQGCLWSLFRPGDVAAMHRVCNDSSAFLDSVNWTRPSDSTRYDTWLPDLRNVAKHSARIDSRKRVAVLTLCRNVA